MGKSLLQSLHCGSISVVRNYSNHLLALPVRGFCIGFYKSCELISIVAASKSQECIHVSRSLLLQEPTILVVGCCVVNYIHKINLMTENKYSEFVKS